jgi:hypothetical protein
LDKTAAGDTPWDESKLGRFVEDNKDAIATLQRASKLPECQWGFEYPNVAALNAFPVPYWRNSARALGRLNLLSGLRLAAKGDSEQAVDTWLAGVRYSQHLAEGGTLIFKYVAEQSLLMTFRLLRNAARSSQLNPTQKQKVRAAVRALPETGFNWSEAWELEGAFLENGFSEVVKSSDPEKAYQALTGEPLPQVNLPPGAKTGNPQAGKGAAIPALVTDFHAFENYISQVAAALTAPPDLARGRIAALETERRTLEGLVDKFIPSASRVNESRAEVAAERESLLQSLLR